MRYYKLLNINRIIFWLLLIILILSLSLALATNKSYLEGFDPSSAQQLNNQTQDNLTKILLLGDSILNNNKYVFDGQAVDDYIKQTFKNVFNVAKDDAEIPDVYSQLNSLSSDLDSKNTYVFLSVGGNDLLKYNYKGKDLGEFMELYAKLVLAVKARLPSANLILLGLYYPQSKKYNKYHQTIQNWNTMVSKLGQKVQGYIALDGFITESDDIVSDIEPSEQGGKKIADAIISFVPSPTISL